MKTLFYSNQDLAQGTGWKRTFKSNSFDTYCQENSNVHVRHSVENDADVFRVEMMTYEYKGCWVGHNKIFGKFDTLNEAIACAESVKLPENGITQSEAFAQMAQSI